MGAQILMVPDLITFLLTGDRGTEASIASTTQLVDVASKRWDVELLGRFGVDDAMVPVIRPLGSDAGEVRLGDHAGMRMVRACEHDTASAVASIGLEPGDAFISCGTWSLVGVARDTPLATPEALAAGLSNESGPDASTLLLANCTGLWIAQQLKIEMEESLGRGLTWQGVAEEVRASYASTFLFDTEDPSLARPGNMLGKLERLAREEGIEGDLGVATLFGSVYESLARQYAQVIERLQRVTGEPIERIRVIGGGSRNAVLCQMVADECGLPVIVGSEMCIRDSVSTACGKRFVTKGVRLMLNGVPANIGPDLLKVLSEMGHGDELVIADGNFPSAALAQRLVRADGMGVPEMLESVLKLVPLDTYVESPLVLMATVEGDPEPPIWSVYQDIADRSQDESPVMSHIDRQEFYERAKRAYAVLATGEREVYANIIVKKGVVRSV